MPVFRINNQMKYLIIPYIALGLVLSLAIGIEYNCEGHEMFPIYYGCPFIFEEKSLGSSMEFYYSISGLLLNVATWSILLIFIRLAILKLIVKFGSNKMIQIIYKGIIVFLIVFTTLNILIDSVMIGHGFKKGLNYWYIDLNKEAKDWGMKCNGDLIIFKK
jgi:hypothetical protein